MTPLHGLRILVTRPEGQADTLMEHLRSLGAEPFLFPAIRILPPEDWSAVDDALRRAPQFDWIVFTSANGVRYTMERLETLGLGIGHLGKVRIAVIGPATARALERWGLSPAVVPREFRSEAVADALGEVRGLRILLLRAEGARKALADILKKRGARVEEVAVYRIHPTQIGARVEGLFTPMPDLVTLTSPSIARALATLALHSQVPLERLPAVCIGPITGAAAREEGFPVVAVARTYTTEGLVEAVVEAAQRLQPRATCQEVDYDTGDK